MKIKNSPYNLTETFGYFKRNFFGPVNKNRGLVEYCPQFFRLNEGIQPGIKIAFIGDIMDMAGRSLHIGAEVRQFVESCDYLVGNFEATITAAKGPIMAQRHIPQILDALAAMFPPEKTYLGLANNHSGDFGYQIWSESKKQIADKGFHIFGSIDVPFIDIEERIRVVAATRWTNQPIDYIPKIETALQYHQPGMFNILYPHWGYELELFPRPEIIQQGKELSSTFNAVISHHSHIPQPIAKFTIDKPAGPENQLIAFGLGDFCIHDKLTHYNYGQILKLTIGPQDKGDWKIGDVEWRFVRCQPKTDLVWETEITIEFPYTTA